MRLRSYAIACQILALLSPSGCATDSDCTPGAERCQCASNNQCARGLACLSGLCVNPTSVDAGPIEKEGGVPSPAADSRVRADAGPPLAGQLCAPCTDTEQCGGPLDLCLQNDITGELFCGQSCVSITDCPSGFECAVIRTGEDQCVPVSGTCGPPPQPDAAVSPPPGGKSDAGGPTTPCGHTPIEQAVLDLHNQARSAQGLHPLKCDAAAVKAAREYSQLMCEKQWFDHDGPDGSTPYSRLLKAGATFVELGENIAQGDATAQAVHNGWMNSPPHRANILDSVFDRIGIGYAPCPSWQGPLWTADFLK